MQWLLTGQQWNIKPGNVIHHIQGCLTLHLSVTADLCMKQFAEFTIPVEEMLFCTRLLMNAAAQKQQGQEQADEQMQNEP
jgi:hypothetical protein